MKLYREMLHVHICFDCRVLQYDIGTCDVPTRIFMYSLITGHIFNAHNSWLLENDSECAVIQYTSGLQSMAFCRAPIRACLRREHCADKSRMPGVPM